MGLSLGLAVGSIEGMLTAYGSVDFYPSAYLRTDEALK